MSFWYDMDDTHAGGQDCWLKPRSASPPGVKPSGLRRAKALFRHTTRAARLRCGLVDRPARCSAAHGRLATDAASSPAAPGSMSYGRAELSHDLLVRLGISRAFGRDHHH